jgi:hypothetical protein
MLKMHENALKQAPTTTSSIVNKQKVKKARAVPPADREERQFCGGGGWGGMSAGEAALLAMKEAEKQAAKGKGMKENESSVAPSWATQDGSEGESACKVKTAIQSVAQGAGMAAAKQAAGAIVRYLTNAAQHPTEQKYRRIKLTNSFFSAKLGSVAGHEELMVAAGFVLETNSEGGAYILLPTVVDLTDSSVVADARRVLSS